MILPSGNQVQTLVLRYDQGGVQGVIPWSSSGRAQERELSHTASNDVVRFPVYGLNASSRALSSDGGSGLRCSYVMVARTFHCFLLLLDLLFGRRMMLFFCLVVLFGILNFASFDRSFSFPCNQTRSNSDRSILQAHTRHFSRAPFS